MSVPLATRSVLMESIGYDLSGSGRAPGLYINPFCTKITVSNLYFVVKFPRKWGQGSFLGLQTSLVVCYKTTPERKHIEPDRGTFV